MHHNFTENDLLLYLYGEMAPEKTALLKKVLKSDSNLNQQYQQLKQVTQVLDTIDPESPNETSVDIIREHSDHFSSLETSS